VCSVWGSSSWGQLCASLRSKKYEKKIVVAIKLHSYEEMRLPGRCDELWPGRCHQWLINCTKFDSDRSGVFVWWGVENRRFLYLTTAPKHSACSITPRLYHVMGSAIFLGWLTWTGLVVCLFYTLVGFMIMVQSGFFSEFSCILFVKQTNGRLGSVVPAPFIITDMSLTNNQSLRQARVKLDYQS
jgi:hypothetical protein